jgi:hypothetical protein
MQTFKVYHAKNHSFQVADVVEFNDENYKLVAEVDAENIEEAYELTNHISQPWTKNKGVRVQGDGRHRSTSVGDVIVTETGMRLVCNVVGWKEF